MHFRDVRWPAAIAICSSSSIEAGAAPIAAHGVYADLAATSNLMVCFAILVSLGCLAWGSAEEVCCNRLRLPLKSTIRFKSSYQPVEVLNINPVSAMVVSRTRLEVGTRISLAVDDEWVGAHVMWTNCSAAGVRFLRTIEARRLMQIAKAADRAMACRQGGGW